MGTMHPLLGKAIPSPVSTKIFQSTLRLKDLNFMRDHQIGSHTIFPEVFYLEMCLVAGIKTIGDSISGLSSQTKAFKIENLKITEPFSLVESKTYHLQTVANISVNKHVVDWGNVKMEIFHSQSLQEIESNTWFPLASGTFTSILNVDEINPAFDTMSFQKTLKTSDNKDFLHEIYNTLASVGLKLGPCFQMLNKVWWNEEDGMLLLKVAFPPEELSKEREYVFHPLLLDAMVKAMMMIFLTKSETKRLAVPTNIGKFIWLQQPNLKSTDVFISACLKNNDEKKFCGSALLVDSTGNVLAVMSSVEFICRRGRTIGTLLDHRRNPTPPFWKEVWLPQQRAGALKVEKENTTKFWLWFGEEETFQLSDYLIRRLAARSRCIIIVNEGNQFEEVFEKGLVRIRVDKEEDFCELFKCLLSKKIDLEGIFYGWALNQRGNVKQEEILRPYFYLTKSLISSGFHCSPHLFTLTQGVIPFNEVDLSSFSASTIWGFTKALKTENMDLNVKIVDLETGSLSEKQLEEVHSELWNVDKEIMVAYRKGTRFCPKFRQHLPSNNSLNLPHGTDRFQLTFPESYSISDIKYEPDYIYAPQENEVEIKTKAFSLNSRITTKTVNAYVTNFSGVVNRVGSSVTKWKVGDRVFGCYDDFKKISSYVIVEDDFLLPLSPQVSFCEGATMCADYLTAVMRLINTAQIKRDDVVLIHNASEGDGLSAIQVCKNVGCTIVATASRMRQLNYLKLQGIQHVFSSENTDFAAKVLDVTNGAGVDVVLNSLSCKDFGIATLKVCRKGARFIQTNQENIETAEQVQLRRPDVKYFVIGLGDALAESKAEKKLLFDGLKELINQKVVKPNPYTKFDAINLEEALKCLETGEHVGNIVCVMPEWKFENGNVKLHTPLFNENGTYLITGGLGGLGFEVCKWMLREGAKYIVLAGRSPPNSQMETEIKKLNLNGNQVVAVRLNVGNLEQCRELIKLQIGKMGLPPLKGVVHTALAKEIGPIARQNWERWGPSFDSKINGPMNLHEVTKTLNLEHFVVFSSISALFGIPFWCNYAAGNCFSDALAHFRYSMGLPGTAINWSQWGEVGISVDYDVPGSKVLSNLQALTGLAYVLKTNQVQLTVANFDSFSRFSNWFPLVRNYVDTIEWNASSGEIYFENINAAVRTLNNVSVIKE